jgi:hypothetical protein
MLGTGIEKEVRNLCYRHNQQNQVHEHECSEMEKKAELKEVSVTVS